MNVRVLAVLVGAVIAAGCGNVPDDPQATSIRDSAGIRIVRSAGATAALGAGPAALRIGRLEGEGPLVLGRPSGAARFGSGNVVVLDALARELRWFDGSGAHVRTRGREGEGPGEFADPVALLRTGDSVAVYDRRLRRMTLFDSAGGLVRTWAVGGPAAAAAGELSWYGPPPFGRLDDGRFLHLASRRPERMGRLRRTAVVVATGPTGEWLGPLVEFPGTDVLVEEIPGGVRQTSGGPHVGDRRASAATDGRSLFVGNGDTYGISVYSAEGELRGILRRPVEPVAADEEQLERQMALLRGHLDEVPPADRPAARRAMSARRADLQAYLARHETLPAYRSLDVAADGRLWVGRTVTPPAADAEYDVYGPDGRLVGTVTLQGEPLFFGGDEVIVAREDERGVPAVAVLPLPDPVASGAAGRGPGPEGPEAP